ncbi:MAG: hydrogen peroxide-inducible genes activator [Bdellovibrionales bacterium]|nr:hydrogen peroxide-inducible genes activator [Bdellovibrionales bacterium]
MPSLTQLEYALAVERLRHFGHAAKACHVSQPTLSQQFQKLEDEVGVMLFDRLQKPVLPTPEGKRFLEQAKAVVREHQKLLHVSRQERAGEPVGEFRLAVIPTVASCLVPLFVEEFARKYPKVELSLDEMKTETLLSELRLDRIDGGILATPVEGATPSLKIHPLYYEPFDLYAAPHHPILKKKLLSSDDLEADQLWLLSEGHCFRNQVLDFCALPRSDHPLLGNIRFQGGSLDTLVRLVDQSKGYTLLPSLMRKTLGRTGRLRPFRPPVPSREVSFVYRRDHWKLDVIAALENTIRACLPKEVNVERPKNFQVLEVC